MIIYNYVYYYKLIIYLIIDELYIKNELYY